MQELPAEFIRLIESYNAPQLSGLPGALLTEPSVSVRVNAAKGALRPDGADIVPWCPEGFYLPSRPQFTFDPAWHQGLYYVQDASSMIVSHVVRHLTADGRPRRLLDACAAPGGKTTAAIAALPEDSVVVANEYVPARCAVLRENLAKWGYGDVAVTQGDTARFRRSPGAFDIILADVPCSGEGMMRKDAEAVAQWSPALVRQCAARQREIVDNLWLALAPGGFLVYSTCTFNRLENEEMIDFLVVRFGAESVEIPVESSWGVADGINTPHHCLRFIPGRLRGEGLFLAVVRKPGEQPLTDRPPRIRPKKNKNTQKSPSATIPVEVKRWVKAESRLWVDGDTLYAAPLDNPLEQRLEWKSALPMATVKGRDFIPTQHLAMSRMLNAGAFASVEVDRPTAISYLSCQAVTLPAATLRGLVLLTCGGHPLGFVKNLGNRANNLYPKPWRILTPGASPSAPVL